MKNLKLFLKTRKNQTWQCIINYKNILTVAACVLVISLIQGNKGYAQVIYKNAQSIHLIADYNNSDILDFEGQNDIIFGFNASTGGGSSFLRALTIKDDTGYVGIGTSSPKARLHVNGTIYAKGHLMLHAFTGDGQSGTAYVQARDISGTSEIGLQLRSQNGAQLVDALKIIPNGNVGIGTTSPTGKLHVYQSTNDYTGGIKLNDSGQTRQFNLFVDGNSRSRIESASDGSGELVLNSGGGNVGIGTTNPSELLHISSGTTGNAKLILEADTDNDDESDNPMIQLSQDGGAVGVYMGFDDDNFGANVFGIGRRYSIDYWNTFVIDINNGNVGIGTATPSEKLEVSGNIKADGVVLNVGTFPDYVFEEDYKLMPLAELEAYIKVNKHLPNVPSEEEVVQNGADLGMLNHLLIEKVEELTLHTIDQHNHNMDQHRVLKAQQEQITQLTDALASVKKQLEELQGR